ncbi:hydrogenase formation protein HypD [bacterium]|nr:hydrogenase formation protein HypD [bacterium]MCK4325463.1 hydrogenase formation protein HypD [bacterium]
MKYIDEFRNRELAQGLIKKIVERSTRPVKLMEVCGTHTVNIFRYGIKELLPETVTLLSGPGCPVCVTPNETIDKAIALSREKDVILVTFGDMMDVPGSSSSLAKEKSQSADIRVVYSVQDALKIATENPKKKTVFLAIGFETTSPTVAVSLIEAEELGLRNYFILQGHKLIPPAMKALVEDENLALDGFICPGHVSTIIGQRPYQFLATQYKLPCVISGFEPLDILQSIYMLINQIEQDRAEVKIQYKRSVKEEGNPLALQKLYRAFQVSDSNWRGLGLIPGSGLKLRNEFKNFDVEEKFPIEVGEVKENPDCICGSILKGIKTPLDCPLFRKVCRPENPIGPCMVSSEGSCAAYYKFRQ